MRGEVLHYDDSQGIGFITGAKGTRYSFERSDLRRLVPIGKGTAVEFQPDGDIAREIFVVRAERAAAAAVPSQFGRFAVQDGPESTGLWSYFWRGITANYVNFRSRARRKEFWGYTLFWLIALVAVLMIGIAIDVALGNFEPDKEEPVAVIVIVLAFQLATFLPNLAVLARRLHDVGLSGWFSLLVLLLLFLYVGLLIVLVFALIPSQKHENKWGPVPAGIRLDAPFASPAA